MNIHFKNYTLSILIIISCAIGLSMNASAHAQTYLIIDEVQSMAVPNCKDNDCVNGHNNSSKIYLKNFLPGSPRHMMSPTNFLEKGYWHIVINTLKAEGKNKGPGSTGSIRITHEGYKDNKGAYYLFSDAKPGSYTEVKNWYEGKPTHYTRKFSDWLTYNKFELPAEAWKKPIVSFSFGPVKSQQEVDRAPHKYHCFYCMTPVTFRARVWITMDPKFVPPMNADDPVGQQPGTAKPSTPARGNKKDQTR